MRSAIICIFTCVSFVATAQMSQEDSLLADAAMWEDIRFWDSLEALEHSYIPFKIGGSWTLYDLDSGEVNNEYSFDEWLPQGNFSESYAFKKDGRYGALDFSGDTLMPFEYDTIATTYYGVFGSKGKDWFFPQYTETEITTDTLQLDSISGKGDLIYLYQDNKVGVYTNGVISIPPVYEAVQPLNVVELYNKSPEVILAFDGAEYRFFDYAGNDLLGTATPEFELMRNDFVRFKKNGRWWYYNFFTKKEFDSKGNAVVLYNRTIYKVYGANRKFPTFYYDNKQQSGYEDYFPLENTFIAFRNSGKIGLMDANGTVQISARYDKIEVIDIDLGYFKFFKGDSCGLMTTSGVELFKPAYANIVSTRDPNRLLIINNNLTGVVDRQGKIIIPAKYDYIEYGNNCFFLEKGNLIGWASIDGEIIFEPQFQHYRVQNGNSWDDSFYAIVFEDYSGKLLLANKRGRLTSKKFNDYNFGNQTFKLYRKNEIEVLILSDDTELEESVTYPNVGSLVVKKDNWDSRVDWGLGGWEKSYLEENQLNGKFGLRFYQEQGLAVDPVYNEIQSTGLDGFFGERPDEGSFELIDGIQLRRRAVYDHMYAGNGAIENRDLVSAESVIHYTSSNWTYTVVGQDKNNHGTIEIPYEAMPFEFSELDEMNLMFSRQFGANIPKMYLIDTKPVVCARDSAEISLFEYYHYFNMLGGLRLTKESAPVIMNPNLGVRFEGGMRRVSEKNSFWGNEERLRFKPWKSFYDFRFTEGEDFVLSKEIGDSALWDLRDYRWSKDEGPLTSRKCIDYKEYSHWFGTRLELKEEGTTKLIIHEEFPDFEFILVDSLKRNYFAGRLIQEDENGWKLVDPDGKLYTSGQDFIRYVGEKHFAARLNGEWSVINRDGQKVIDRTFTTLGRVTDGYFSASNKELEGIYSVNGEVLVESSETLNHVEGSLYKVRLTPEEVWYDAATKIYDTLKPDETYLGNSTFYSKKEGGEYTLRKFGESKQRVVSTEIKPYCVLDAVVFKKKKKLFILDAKGEVTTYKKASKPREYGQFMRIDGKKKRLILNQEGILIHTADEDARLRTYRDELWVHTSDTNYLVSQTGEIGLLNSEKIKPSVQAVTKDLEIVRESGKFGAQRNGESILPANYDRLYYNGNGEFTATQNYTANLFDNNLKRMNAIPYHQCFFIDEDIMILELNGAWYFYQKGEDWERITAK